jgi:hypothetical protein
MRHTHTRSKWRYAICAVCLAGCWTLTGGGPRSQSTVAGAPPSAISQDTSSNSSWVLAIKHQLYLGENQTELSTKLADLLLPVTGSGYLEQHPFRSLIPYTDSTVTMQWRTRSTQADGWPGILFVVFADAYKTNLVDALAVSSGNVQPVVDGLYNRSLHSIRTGDSVAKLYRVAGQRNCEYFLREGRWEVRFTYITYGGRLFLVEANAGDGTITYARDGTL